MTLFVCCGIAPGDSDYGVLEKLCLWSIRILAFVVVLLCIVYIYGRCAKKYIPQRRANAIRRVFIVVVVAQVVVFQKLADAIFHGEVMGGIVDGIVGDVASDKPAKQRVAVGVEQPVKEEKERGSKRNAHQ